MTKIIGAHLSTKKGIDNLQKEMEIINANCCAVFLKNQKRYSSSQMSQEVIDKFKQNVIYPEFIVPHGSYLINLGNPQKIELSFPCLIDDLQRCNNLGIRLYNLHPGSDVTKMGNKSLDFIAENLNKAISTVPNVVILLENMAGQGNCTCSKFSDIAYIIDKVECKERIGVCLDTCHLYGAGYDIRTKEKFQEVMDEFEKVVGTKYLKAMHLNDSKMELGTKKDRHEHLGKGKIGLEAFEFIMNSEVFDNIPMILETPNESLYGQEIELLRSLVRH